MLLSFLECIDTSRQSLLHEGFFAVGVLVVVCGFCERIIRSIGRSMLHGEVSFGLTCLKHEGLRDK